MTQPAVSQLDPNPDTVAGMAPSDAGSAAPEAASHADATPVPSTIRSVRDGGSPRPATLSELVEHLARIEAAHHSDLVLDLRRLSMTPQGLLRVPDRGLLLLNDWSRSQLGSLLGFHWNRWRSGADIATVASEVNRRLERCTEEVRVRSAAIEGHDGQVRALVSPGYTPVPDTLVAALVAEALEPFGEARVQRLDVTERATFFAVTVGKPMRPVEGSRVGDLAAGLTVRNSGTGYCSLAIRLSLQRLACLNGLVLSEGSSVSRAHRGLDVARVRGLLLRVLGGFGERMKAAQEMLERASKRVLSASPQDEIARVVDKARLPKRLVPLIEEAYGKEPEATAFGISQALTLAAQGLPPEERFDLEALAGEYLSDAT
jgi:hypothetical protein